MSDVQLFRLLTAIILVGYIPNRVTDGHVESYVLASAERAREIMALRLEPTDE